MVKVSFREYSKIQSIICNDHAAGKDELIVTLNGDHIQLTISENEDDMATFILYKDGLQHLMDWLRIKEFVS